MPERLEWTSAVPEGRSVLVVDDEAPLCELLARWLADDGWHCLRAHDSVQALQVLAQHSVQVVTCDLSMPGPNGIWLLDQIARMHPDIAVLVLTAAMDTRTAIEALTKGAIGYLLKPVQNQELILQVRRAWERGQLLRERRDHLLTLERRVREQTISLRRAQEETIHRLVMASSYRDEETGAHIRRTGLFSELLARCAGWSKADAEQLRMAAPMHDVGKIGIADAILRKPGQLTETEFEQMKQHTTIGARMLAGSRSSVLQLAEKIALWHHERWDGNGYPHRLSDQQIPEAARIVTIVDVYDALSHDRVYRPALPDHLVLKIMGRGAGTHFDPQLLALFLANFDSFHEISAAHPDEESPDLPTGDESMGSWLANLAAT